MARVALTTSWVSLGTFVGGRWDAAFGSREGVLGGAVVGACPRFGSTVPECVACGGAASRPPGPIKRFRVWQAACFDLGGWA